MTDKIRESLSALMDDELSEIELHRLLRQFSSDDDVQIKESWMSFQQIRSLTNGEANISAERHLELHSRISAAIHEEESEDLPAPITTSITTPMAKWTKPAAGFAVAASLFVAVFFVNQTSEQSNSELVNSGFVNSELVNSETKAAIRNIIDAQTVSTAPSKIATISPSINPESLAFNGEGEQELRALDAEKQNRLREYLNRHEQMTRKNPLSRTVSYPNKSSDN